MDKLLVFKLKCFLVFSCLTFVRSVFSQVDTINFYRRSLLELSQLYVTSEKKEKQRLSNTSAKMRVITREQIENKAYFTLEDALAELPGFQFRNILGLNSYSFLRGLPRQNNAILVLVDGIQINELNSGGFYGGGQYNLANVERIEVMYGPASVIYGTNAISGIINIITKDPGENNELLAHAAIGNFNTYLTDITYSHKKEHTGIQLSGMVKTSEKADLSDGNNDNNWDRQMEIFETDYAFDAKVIHKGFVAGINSQNRRSSTSTNYPSVHTIHKGAGTLWNLRLINAYLKNQAELSENLNHEAVIFYRNATILGNSVKEVTDTGCVAYYRPNDLIGVEENIELTLNNHLWFVTGIFGHYESLASGYSKAFSSKFFVRPEKPENPEKETNVMGGAFVKCDYQFYNYWQLVPGLRYEYSTLYGRVFTPRVSLLFHNKGLNLKLIYAQAFRAPKPWDFTSGTGNPGLKPEYFNSWELSTLYFFSKKIKGSVSVYYNNLFSGLRKNTTSENNFYWENSGSTITRGAETEVQYISSKLNWHLNYSFNRSTDDKNEVVPEISPHMGVVGVDYKAGAHFNIGLRGFYIGRKKNTKAIKATGSEYIDEAVVLNLYLSVRDYKNAGIQFVFKNVTNTEYYHTSNLAPDRYRQPQFSYLLQLSYKITGKND